MERTVNKLVILGSTGSVGRQTLDIVRAFPGRFEIFGLCNGFNTELLKIQIDELARVMSALLGISNRGMVVPYLHRLLKSRHYRRSIS